MSLTFAELNKIVDFNIREWAKTVDNEVIIIKNTSIPEEIFNCVKEAHEKGYTTEEFCIDCYYENCFDYDFDFAVTKWLKDNNDRDNGFLISQLYAQCVLKNI